jgi:hypothetical protein
MHHRNSHQNQHQEPKIIALAAAKTNSFTALLWQIGMALLAYGWLSLVLK